MLHMNFILEKIVHVDYNLSYRLYAGGKKKLFVFHGYGQTTEIFDSLIASVLPDYTVVAIDLFFHGNSEIVQQSSNYISIKEWNRLLDEILTKHSIQRFSLLSFSIGSRFVFATMQNYSKHIDRIALVAPDGFGNNFWFRMATSNVVCRYVFKLTLRYPPLIIYPAIVFNFVGVIHTSTLNFIQKSLKFKKDRERIYNTWVYFRKLKMHSKEFAHAIDTSSIQVLFVTGSKDDLVARHTIKKISDRVEARYMELPFAHGKMVQAIHSDAVIEFLVADR